MLMNMRKRRKPAAGEIVIIVIITIIIVLSCVFFITRAGVHGEQVVRDNGTDSMTENEIGNGAENGHERESGYETVSTPETGGISATTPYANRITIIDIAEMYPELQTELDEEARSHNSAGVSLAVYDGHSGLFYTYRYGYADIGAGRLIDINTKIRVASLSKLVVAICAMKLVDTDRLDLDEDIGAYLGYQVRSPHYPDIPITARMLLQHTSSIHDSDAFHESVMGGLQISTQSLLERERSYITGRPGSSHLYSNFGYSILGAIIEHVSGMKLDAFARQILFTPLDIDAAFHAANLDDASNIATLYDIGHSVVRSVDNLIESRREGDIGQDQHIAQGGLLISAFDFAKILAMLGNGGVFLDERILSQEAVVEIHRTDVSGPGYTHGLSTRFTVGGSAESAEDVISAVIIGDEDVDALAVSSGARDDTAIWRYAIINGLPAPSDGFFWHTGSAHGVFAQYIYLAGIDTNEGVGRVDANRGIVVITTGASTERMENGMINVCNHLSEIAWRGVGFSEITTPSRN